jgi:hypothetical protein
VVVVGQAGAGDRSPWWPDQGLGAAFLLRAAACSRSSRPAAAILQGLARVFALAQGDTLELDPFDLLSDVD